MLGRLPEGIDVVRLAGEDLVVIGECFPTSRLAELIAAIGERADMGRIARRTLSVKQAVASAN